MGSEVRPSPGSNPSLADLKQDGVTAVDTAMNSGNCTDSSCTVTNTSVDTDQVMEDVSDDKEEPPAAKQVSDSAAGDEAENTAATTANDEDDAVMDDGQPVGEEVDEAGEDHQEVEAAGVTSVPLPETCAPCDPLQLSMVNELLACSCPDSSIVQPPGKLALPLPRDGFMCDQCGDRFVLPSSLAQHMARRVMNIFYRCPDCKKTCLMANKCQFLEHLDSHGLDAENLDATLVDVQPLSAADLGVQTKVLPPSEESLLTGPPKLTQMAQPNKVNKPVPVSCPVCNVLCTTTTLASHLCPHTAGATLDKPPPRCPDCAQPCPTECCLIAHQGLHKPDLWPYPYVCPECGVKVLGSLSEYRQHVIGDCLHLTRDLKACCSLCLIEVGDVSAHMLQTHVQKLYKCRLCPLAFESVNGFSGHVRAKHDEQQTFSGSDTPCLTILKCPFCSATFNSGKTLREHMAGPRHGAKVLELVKFVFRCPVCDLDYGRKELLSDHVSRSHPDFWPVLAPAEDSDEDPSPVAPVAPLRGSGSSSRGRGRGKSARHSHPDTSRSESVIQPQVHKCCVCASAFRNKSAWVEHARAHLHAAVPLCLLCNVRFGDEQQLKVHIAEHASTIGGHRCGLCYTRTGSRDSLQHHLESEHNMRDFTCQLCRLVFPRLTDLHRHTQSKHAAARVGRPAKRVQMTPPASSSPPREHPSSADAEEDDLPLSVTARALSSSGRRGTLPTVTSLYQLDDSALVPGSPGSAVTPPPRHVNRRGRPRGGNTAAAVRASTAALKLKQEVDVMGELQADDPPFIEQPAPPLPDSGYRCVHCGWETSVRATFVTHVRSHRSSSSQHQCVECGQCYSTRTSLRKHLLLVHRVRGVPVETDGASESERWLRVHQAPGGPQLGGPQRRDAETLEQIAQFVAASGPGVEVVDGGDDADEQVIELEMKEGEITQKQLRTHVAVTRPGDSSDEEEEEQERAVENPVEQPVATNGQTCQ